MTTGDKDDIVKKEDVDKFAEKLKNQKYAQIEYRVFEGADHYYRNAQDELETTMSRYIEGRMNALAETRRLRPDKKRRQLPRD